MENMIIIITNNIHNQNITKFNALRDQREALRKALKYWHNKYKKLKIKK